ncbi:MAG TPA: hypothetical protein VJQ84_07750, partial [Solirubrobacterales bacterium]|nr:hypothetical protein [Solirubrobacterales bacterium]
PVGSDRAYEQVSLPDSSGNPVDSALAISDNGDRMLYRIHGGNPVSNTGDTFNLLFTERTASGWKTRDIMPAREDLIGSGWFYTYANNDLSSLASINNNHGTGLTALYDFFPDAPSSQLYSSPSIPGDVLQFNVSDDMSRIILLREHLFEVASGVENEVDQLPDGTFPTCTAGQDAPRREPHWLSSNGELIFFHTRGHTCSGPEKLYVRNLDQGVTKLISPAPVSGPDCSPRFIRSTSDAAFFWSGSRLTSAASAPELCDATMSGDIYRYDLGDESVKCLTCLSSGIDADVAQAGDESIAIAEDGSRIYFNSPNALIPGGAAGVYRIDVSTGDIAFVAAGVKPGTWTTQGDAISRDGSVLIFTSKSPTLNALGGQQNGGRQQYYRYDDDDRSLVCISCPQDGSAPTSGVEPILVEDRSATGPNLAPLSEDTSIVAFATPSPLVNADQNTSPSRAKAGTDVYEWRDGRLLLVTDGLTNWPVSVANNGTETAQAPQVGGVSRSGKDIYFIAPAQYTPDALDGYARIYDARIGGGFEFTPPPKPCPLEVCQGTPKGAPEEARPGSTSFAGNGNANPKQKARRAKSKAHKKKAHKKKQHKRRANHKRRTAR